MTQRFHIRILDEDYRDLFDKKLSRIECTDGPIRVGILHPAGSGKSYILVLYLRDDGCVRFGWNNVESRSYQEISMIDAISYIQDHCKKHADRIGCEHKPGKRVETMKIVDQIAFTICLCCLLALLGFYGYCWVEHTANTAVFTVSLLIGWSIAHTLEVARNGRKK